MGRRTLVCVMLVTLIIISHADLRAQKPPYSILKTFHASAMAGGYDYIAICPANNNLYVSHGTQVNILDRTTGDSVGVIRNTVGVHGIAFAPDAGKGYTSNGRLNNVFAFDLKTNRIVDSIRTGNNPDAICYEPYTRSIVVCNGRDNSITIIDTKTDKAVSTIAVPGNPETAVPDGTGMIFVDIEDKNEVAAIDMKTMKVVQHYPLGSGKEPAGLAIDLRHKWLYVGCGNKQLVILTTDGKIIKTLPIGDHCDGVAYDAGTNTAFASNGEGTLSVINQKRYPKNDFVVMNISTKRGARTLCVDENTHLIYLPTAEFEQPAAGSKERPRMKPGTFTVLVVGK